MRGIPSLITDIRKKVFTEVARMAYNGDDYTKAEDLPYIIVPGDQPLHRESVFLERAIAGERVRLAMGLSVRSVQTRSLMTAGGKATPAGGGSGLEPECKKRPADGCGHRHGALRKGVSRAPGSGQRHESDDHAADYGGAGRRTDSPG